jgi:hypothetical protein
MLTCIWDDYFEKEVTCERELNCEECDVLNFIHGMMAEILKEKLSEDKEKVN